MTNKLISILIILLLAIAAVPFLLRPLGVNLREETIRQSDPTSLRSTPLGKVLGYAEGRDTHGWLGIPYAKPPVAERRWRPPESAAPWEETREAIAHQSICAQVGSRFGDPEMVGKPTGSEDCLYLNVFAPQFAPDRIPSSEHALPVMVWIHGGGNTIGSSDLYTPMAHKLAGSHNLVVVTINYRLGMLGWFRHPSLNDDDATAIERSGNYATLDTIEALRWVQENIAAFGGDPNNVTIFGESAGGRNVFALMVSPLAEGLFHKAISQSGIVGNSWSIADAENYYDDENEPGWIGSSAEVLLRLLQKEGQATSRSDAKEVAEAMSPDEIRDYLRSRTPAQLLRSTYHERPRRAITLPLIVVDGTVIPMEHPRELFKDPAKYNSVPLISGTNKDEERLFMVSNPKHVYRLLGILPRARDRESYERNASYNTDLWKARSVDIPLQIMAEAGTTAYGYRFDWDEGPEGFLLDYHLLLGAAHALEIPFVFNAHEIGDSVIPNLYTKTNLPGVKKLSNAMSSYWAEFAYTGNPGRGRDGTLPEWKAWSADPGDKYIILDTSTDGGIRMGSRTYTIEEIKQRFIDDIELLGGQKELCKRYVYRFLSGFAKGDGSIEEYNTFGPEGCADYPPLWFEDLEL